MQSSSALWEITERLGEMACLREEQQRLVAHRGRGVEPGEGRQRHEFRAGWAGWCDGVISSEHCQPHGCCEVALDQRRVPKVMSSGILKVGGGLAGVWSVDPTAWRGR